jgi:hypothetical protein
MKRLIDLFTVHPHSVGETYYEHFLAATMISMRLGLACLSQFAHAIFPFIYPPFGSDIKSLLKFLNKINPNVRNRTNSD